MIKNKNVIFLGGLFPKEIRKEIENNSRGVIQYAADAFQWNFVRGLDTNLEYKLNIINAPLVGSYPKFYKKIFLNRQRFSFNENLEAISVAYCNLPVVKNYFIKKALLQELIYLVNKLPQEEVIVVVYGMLGPWVLAAKEIKQKYPQIKLCLIVPDLPEYMSNSTALIWKIRQYFQPNLYKVIPVFDFFVFLTDEMAVRLDVEKKPWVRIEGMVNPSEIYLNAKAKHPTIKKIILYSGTLTERFGILKLLDVFESINNANFELWICGDGDTREIIKKRASIDLRIKYWGLLPRERVLQLQQKATVLINPRNADGEYTKYSFPSKTMEYILSGTPCIIYSLPGIPSDYHQFVFLIDANDAESMKNKIIEVCEMDQEQLILFGEKARQFVIKDKNYIVQAKKMFEMFASNKSDK